MKTSTEPFLQRDMKSSNLKASKSAKVLRTVNIPRMPSTIQGSQNLPLHFQITDGQSVQFLFEALLVLASAAKI